MVDEGRISKSGSGQTLSSLWYSNCKKRLIDDKLFIAERREIFAFIGCEVVVVVPVSGLVATSDLVALAKPHMCTGGLSLPLN
jgi:hypothetical protein